MLSCSRDELRAGDETAVARPTNNATAAVPARQPERTAWVVTVSGGGSVTRNPELAVYGCGDPVQLTANPDPGWIFTSWTGDLEGTGNPTNITDPTITITMAITIATMGR